MPQAEIVADRFYVMKLDRSTIIFSRLLEKYLRADLRTFVRIWDYLLYVHLNRYRKGAIKSSW